MDWWPARHISTVTGCDTTNFSHSAPVCRQLFFVYVSTENGNSEEASGLERRSCGDGLGGGGGKGGGMPKSL